LKWFEISREQAFIWLMQLSGLMWLIAGALGLYQFLIFGVVPSPGESRQAAVVRSLRRTGSRASDLLFGGTGINAAPVERLGELTPGVFFAALAAILFAKNKAYLDHLFDLHWHMPFLDYDLDWHTPAFSLAGNVLYDFGMQIPLNTSLSPLNGLAHLVPASYRLATAYTLLYLAASGLLWTIGYAAGLRPIARGVFAGFTALIVTMPYG